MWYVDLVLSAKAHSGWDEGNMEDTLFNKFALDNQKIVEKDLPITNPHLWEGLLTDEMQNYFFLMHFNASY